MLNMIIVEEFGRTRLVRPVKGGLVLFENE